MNPIVVVGGGVNGCVIAHGLAKKGYEVVLIEKEAGLGGLAKTFRYGDFSFDIGPHRFFTLKDQTSSFIKDVLKNDYSIIFRHSEVYFEGKYYSWPLRFSALFGLPLDAVLESARDLFLANTRNKKSVSDNFKDFVTVNYGPVLCDLFFREYTQKFLGLPPEMIHSDWAKEGMKRAIIDERISLRNLFDILRLFFESRTHKIKFIYPKVGIGVFCDKLSKEAIGCGMKVWTGVPVTGLECFSGSIEEVCFDGKRIKPEKVIWTAPISEICRLLKLECAGLEYRSLLIFNIEMNKLSKKSYQWCYYGSSGIIFNRVTMPLLFNKNMSSKGRTGLCVEITCREGDRQWNNPETLINRVREDLIKVGLVEQLKDIGDIHIEKISNAYPIYTLNYLKDKERVSAGLKRFENLILSGRAGLFWYNNMDDSIENGLEVVNAVIRGKNEV